MPDAPGVVPVSCSALLGGAFSGLARGEVCPQRPVDGLRGVELGRDIRVQEDQVGAFAEATRVLPAHAFGEVVLLAGLVVSSLVAHRFYARAW